MLTVEQVVASHKANIETLMGLTSKAFEGVEKIVEIPLTDEEKGMLAKSAASVQGIVDVVKKTPA